MTSRDRIAAILRREVPDRMGLYEHFWPETLNAEWPAQGYPSGVSPEVEFDYDIAGCGGWFASEPFPGRYEVVAETDEWRIARDGRGASLKHWKAKSGTPEHIGFDCDTPDKWRTYREPLLEVNPSRLDFAGARAALQGARERGKYAVFGNLFVFELLRATLGDANFLPALLVEPDWIRDFCRVYLNHFRSHYDLLFREAGKPDGMFIYEDFGFANGLFCSPRTLAEVIMPYEKELVGFFHDHGLPVVLHACGDVRKAVPLFIEAGFDCLQPMEAKAGCDVVELARTYGTKLAYMGNMNVVALSTNDRTVVEAEVAPKLAALRDMRIPYVFHSDHSVPPDIRLDTYRYALELLRVHGSYA
ncbi:MAG TPA: uroporphyrinogen decarboxylase family protein [Chthonomonadales bacterium]|nr:uroporphyrinogen decarboxylase family protein [Chthonomonadales bacterium]